MSWFLPYLLLPPMSSSSTKSSTYTPQRAGPKPSSTCSFHVSAVAVFYGSAAFMYLQPSSVSPMEQRKVSFVFYTCTVPMMNPVICSLWNKDVKLTLRKILYSGKCRWIDSMSWCYIRVKRLLRYIIFQFYCSNFWKFRIIFPYNTFPKFPSG